VGRGLTAALVLCALALGARPAAAATALCAPMSAQEQAADPGAALLAETNHTGVVDLYLDPAAGVPVTFFECVRGRPHALGTAQPDGTAFTGLRGAVPWACGRRVRHFVSTATVQGQLVRREVSARTPGCAHRFTLTGTRRGRVVAVKVTDTWGIGGIHARLCLRSPAGARRCRVVAFAPAVGARTVRFRARGRWTLDLRVHGFHVRGAVGRAAGRPLPVLLATGDSTMQGVDSALSDDLAGFHVVSSVALGGEISLGGWPKIARGQVAALHPAVVVVSVGATEGFPMTSPDGTRHDCCDPGWVAEYVRRARAMMRTYRQGGRARVYWETVALSKEPARAAIVRTINQAFITAAQGLSGVTVLRMDLLFSPHGYQETIRDGGRDVRVREDDGVHLNASGTAIEARETARAIQART
jgi:lysophospholipase L1-like esterase